MSDPTSPTAPDAAAPDVLVDHDHDLAAVVRAASIDEGSPGALYRCGPEAVAACVRALAADNERLREGFGRAVDAHEDDALAVWRALGGTHEPPDDTATIIDAIERLTAALARLRAPAADVAAIGARAAAARDAVRPRRTCGECGAVDPVARVIGGREFHAECPRLPPSDHYPVSVTERSLSRDETEALADDVTALLALLAAEREGHAAEVAGARAAALREAGDVARAEMALWADALDSGSEVAIARHRTASDIVAAIAALGAKGGG